MESNKKTFYHKGIINPRALLATRDQGFWTPKALSLKRRIWELRRGQGLIILPNGFTKRPSKLCENPCPKGILGC